MQTTRRRLTIDLTKKQKDFLDHLPHGYKQQIYSALTDMLIDMVSRCGEMALFVVMKKALNIEDYFIEEEK